MEHGEGTGGLLWRDTVRSRARGTLVLIITIFQGCPISLVLTTVYYYLISRLLEYNPLQ
jgi:hypothetical protein